MDKGVTITLHLRSSYSDADMSRGEGNDADSKYEPWATGK